ncbi:uncharacterized protein [Battus philenor]|uniref:uncharacterized protein n=1 Tax=Battus philenor TaxID=42288 RepID=UPI0035D09F66
MTGARHLHTTAYHPAANGMVERLHRQLKAAIMCHDTSSWTESLPLVLMGIRSSWKEDLQASPAELVYGEPLQLPGQFLAPVDDYTTADVTQYATRLRAHKTNLSPKPSSWHTKVPFYIPRDLNTTSHVFLRQDHVRGALEPPYAGPFKVLERHPKFFTIELRGKPSTVSVDRLKPAYLAREVQVPNQVIPLIPKSTNLTTTNTSTATATSTTSTATTSDGDKRTRSGRRVRLPNCYRP